jgi:ubiquinone/menaquinone biosynthesis C-methylase UbiE
MMTEQKYKDLSIKEFTRAAEVYDSGHAGVYEMCKDDYPPVLDELKKYPFQDLLDVGCGTGPMIELLVKEFPDGNYTGIDLTPRMIEVAQAKKLPHTKFLVGDSENLPFKENTFDVVICTNSFHHYPNPQAFLDGVARVLKDGGRLVLRDYTSNRFMIWLMNHIEMPLAHLGGHGDVRIYSCEEVRKMCEEAGLKVEKLEMQKEFRMHLVAIK